MFADWLSKKISVAVAEAKHAVTSGRLVIDPVPFGFHNDRWIALINRMQVNNELWEFNSAKQLEKAAWPLRHCACP